MKKISFLLAMLLAVSIMAYGCGGDKKTDEDKTQIEADGDKTDATGDKSEDKTDDKTDDKTENPDTAPETPVSNIPEKPVDTKPNTKPTTKPTEGNTASNPGTKPSNPAPTPPPVPEPAPASLSAADVHAQILKNYDEPKLVAYTSEQLSTFYGIDATSVKSFCVKGPQMNVKVNEIAVFELNNASDAATIKKACEKRAADVAKSFETYLQDQYELAKNPSIVVSGNYVFMAMSDNASSMAADFKAALK